MLNSEDTFARMSDDSLMKEIMEEVESLQHSIEEYCPEIISHSQYPSIKDMGDDMNKLIEHRLKLLETYSKELTESSKND